MSINLTYLVRNCSVRVFLLEPTFIMVESCPIEYVIMTLTDGKAMLIVQKAIPYNPHFFVIIASNPSTLGHLPHHDFDHDSTPHHSQCIFGFDLDPGVIVSTPWFSRLYGRATPPVIPRESRQTDSNA